MKPKKKKKKKERKEGKKKERKKEKKRKPKGERHIPMDLQVSLYIPIIIQNKVQFYELAGEIAILLRYSLKLTIYMYSAIYSFIARKQQ